MDVPCSRRARGKSPQSTTIGVAPSQKDPVLVDTLRALVEPMRRDDPRDVRDRALLCLGFAGGCRRSELVALDVEDLSFGDDGLELTIRRSKTNQEGLGRKEPPHRGK